MSELALKDYGISEQNGIQSAIARKGCVYILQADNCIKIGRSQNPELRIETIRTTSGRNIAKKFITEPCNNYCQIENEMHKIFKDNRIVAEWFDVDFDSAVTALKAFHLDKRDVKSTSCNAAYILDGFTNYYMKTEMQKFLNERPHFKEYLSRNNYFLSFDSTEDEIMVTDKEDMEMPLRMFIALYKSGVKV